MKVKLFKKKRSLRFTCILATTSIFVIITTSHVAKYIVSLGLDDIVFGWAFAIALDAAIVTCGWLTSKKTKTTQSWSLWAYYFFVVLSGIMNVGYVAPWKIELPIESFIAWSYSISPTAGIAILAMILRKVDEIPTGGGVREAKVAQKVAKVVATKKEWRELCAKYNGELAQCNERKVKELLTKRGYLSPTPRTMQLWAQEARSK